ncbi:MAG: hypothetical protein HOV80_33285 [Polyangiaceae bacterium]|nr:hypothetical protein [Polyangiaceae bacterium]
MGVAVAVASGCQSSADGVHASSKATALPPMSLRGDLGLSTPGAPSLTDSARPAALDTAPGNAQGRDLCAFGHPLRMSVPPGWSVSSQDSFRREDRSTVPAIVVRDQQSANAVFVVHRALDSDATLTPWTEMEASRTDGYTTKTKHKHAQGWEWTYSIKHDEQTCHHVLVYRASSNVVCFSDGSCPSEKEAGITQRACLSLFPSNSCASASAGPGEPAPGGGGPSEP